MPYMSLWRCGDAISIEECRCNLPKGNERIHNLIKQSLEVSIDDIAVKFKPEEKHLTDVNKYLQRIGLHKLKMNPKKCAFWVRWGNFLGFLVH